MYVDNKQYNVNLNDINRLRYLLFTNFYSDPIYLMQLQNSITNHIDNLDIEFDSAAFTFIIKIKKTTMRKRSGFRHDPNYYYTLIQNIFLDFIRQNHVVVHALLTRSVYHDDAEQANTYLNNLYTTPSILANLCHVSCMADNILVIKL